MKFGLLGKSLSHSFSPKLHKYFGDYSYSLFEVSEDGLSDFMSKKSFEGINVTIPYKKSVLPYCTHLSHEAEKIGSVNTIKVLPDGSLFGDNTDYYGFKKLCEYSEISFAGKKVLVLGDGGAAAAIRAVLEDSGVEEIITISRKGKNNYENISLHFDGQIIVNTTPIGMYPENNKSLVDLDSFPRLEGVLDIVYNPLRTKLIMDAEKKGIPSLGGLLMLVFQAQKASEIFTEKPIDEEKAFWVYKKLLAESENIVLIGMPGCGKSTVGKALSDLTGRSFFDSDEIFVEKAGISIEAFFEKFGEEAFRKKETEILDELGILSGVIIATGGGAVTRKENYPLLHQNSKIYFLERDITKLPSDGRPISKTRPISEIAKERLPLYNAWCDKEVLSDTPLEKAIFIKEDFGL